MRKSLRNRFLVVFFLGSISGMADDFALKQVKINEKAVWVASIQLRAGEPSLQLSWKNDKGKPLRSFENLKQWLNGKGKSLLFATNGGIYRDDPDLAPIGLHVENGNILTRLSFAKGCGNFCWYSGVFIIRDNRATIVPRENVPSNVATSRLALQSGPLFLRNGKLQGKWSDASYNLNRSAVCTTNIAGEVLWSMVPDATNFREFFDLLKKLRCENALFLDGAVSSFYDGSTGKRIGNQTDPYAGMLAVTRGH